MPDRDRDQSVERLLRQVLTEQAATSAQGGCVDAETMAAWTAGALPAQAASALERHVADCGRCQALMATFLRTAPEPAAPVAWWRQWRLAWLVPAATAATALALWFALPGRGPVPVQSQPEPAAQAKLEMPQPPVAPAPRAAEPEGRVARADEASRANQAAPAAPAPAALAAPTSGATPAERDTTRESVTDALKEEVTPARQRLAAAIAPAEIVAPNSAFRWRITPDSRVEWSDSAGTAWQGVDLGPSARLTAGSGTSPSTCWLVGRAGSVFVTTDGTHFTRVNFPEQVDLVAVSAADGRSATVASADGRSWRTTDQGTTWTPLGR